MSNRATHTTIKAALAVAGLVLAADAQAQIGSGWTRYYPSKTLQRIGGSAYYSNVNGIETFRIGSGDERCEQRTNNNYTSGNQQFEGHVNVRSGANGSTVHQVFGGSAAATAFMLRSYNPNGGELRRYSGTTLRTGIYGVWIRVNTIHDANNNRVTAYLNGSNRGTWPDNGNNTHYHKYGVYGGGSSNPQAQWRYVKYFRK